MTHIHHSLVPAEEVKYTAEVYLPEVTVRSQMVYISLLLAILAVLASLPFIYVNVSVSSRGQVQSEIERQDIIAPVAGYINLINTAENRYVNKNDVLFAIDGSGLEKQDKLKVSRQRELQAYISDIESLLKGGTDIATGNYKLSQLQYQEQLEDAANKVDKTRTDHERMKQLYNEKVIASAEYENYKLSFEQAQSAYNLVIKKQQNTWKAEEQEYRKELADIEADKLQLAEDKKKYMIRAPVTGSIQQLQGIQTGSYIMAGQKIAEISPDKGMVVQCYVPPSSIGLIKMHQEVFIQVDAFNYNEWGMLKGVVTDISSDILLVQQQPVFRVKCSINRQYLALKNGYKGYLKKGMTLQARFIVARRSIFRLLYDRLDDWMNPSRST